MPLSKPVLIRLLNNGTGTMAPWPRQLPRNRLIPRVCKPFHRAQYPRPYSTTKELSPQSFVTGNHNDYINHGVKRHFGGSISHGQVLGASDLDSYTDVEKAYGRLRIEASRGSKEGGLNAYFLAEHIVRTLGKRPDMRIYSSLILANCRQEGSVGEVRRLLRELRAEGFDLDSSACHDVLKVCILGPLQ